MLSVRLVLASSLLALAFPARGRSQRSLGLIQDVDAMSRTQALTMSARGGSALFFNPACLVYNRFDFRLIGVEAIADKRLLDAKRQHDEQKKVGATNAQSTTEEDLKRAYDLVQSDQPVSALANARVIDFAVPYVGIQSFASTEVSTGRVLDAEQPTVQADIMLRTGAIGGFAMLLGPLAVGYSKYFLIESDMEERLTTDQIESMQREIEADPSAADRIQYRDFTTASYGNTEGHNFGLLYQPFDENPSGLGLAVLNAGGSRFKRALPRRYSKLKPYQKELEQKADEYGIELALPEKIPQIVNAGLLVGYGGSRHDNITANLALDFDDIGGEYLDVNKKFAASTEIGFMLPDELAMLVRREVPIYDPDKKQMKGSGFYLGFLGLKATAGIRPHDRYAYGVSLLGHAGTKSVSFLKFALQTMVEKPIDPQLPERVGAQASIALTFIWEK